MPFTAADADALSRQLPSLHDLLNDPGADKLPLLTRWSQHYHTDFVQEGLCQQHLCGTFDAAGYRIACHLWLQAAPRGTLFFLHGFTDHVGLMQHALRYLLQQGWNLVAFDLPGHGLSSGERCSIGSFDEYRLVLEACLALCATVPGRLPRPWHGAGQSTGGAVWLNYLCQHPSQEAIDRICLLAPLLRPKSWGHLQYALPLLRHLRQLPRKFTSNSHDEAFLDFVRNADPLQYRHTPLRWAEAMHRWQQQFVQQPPLQRPLLLVQGDDDGTIDFRYNLTQIQAVFPNSQTKMIPGARHQLVNELPPYRDQALQAMGDWLGAPATAAD
ncbi:alpha/beta hydrolase [Pseudomaricurvus sp. HS19]|uniref:alpha/beta hydrolase n=1 Tax=Pseudomaricurvus sp. HS19 TaxID=2692626 RepID=UPI001369B992|nr:alpha/beta hydrolase [Pseudomaricurvus sp. HS19]MYM63545.1 alpha/beta fold hydrolase [Pseudomaricurvus sp. HS19]